jgi:hypothetical protein
MFIPITIIGCIVAFAGTFVGGRTVVAVGLAIVLADYYLI